MMSSIYPYSRGVICWLGEEDEYSARAFDVLNRWERADKDESLRLELGKMSSSDIGPKEDKTLNLQPDRDALASFFSREWFHRTWSKLSHMHAHGKSTWS